MPETNEVLMTLSKADLLELIREAKKPDDETALKMAEEKQRKERAKAEMVENVRAEQAAKEQRQTACDHKKERGESAVRGQIHSDGLFHPICMRCQKEFTPQTPPQSSVAQGIG